MLVIFDDVFSREVPEGASVSGIATLPAVFLTACVYLIQHGCYRRRRRAVGLRAGMGMIRGSEKWRGLNR